jgi:hypothetical protein
MAKFALGVKQPDYPAVATIRNMILLARDENQNWSFHLHRYKLAVVRHGRHGSASCIILFFSSRPVS